jgi:hypothetical protein
MQSKIVHACLLARMTKEFAATEVVDPIERMA